MSAPRLRPRSRALVAALAVMGTCAAMSGLPTRGAQAAAAASTPLISGHYYTIQSVSSRQDVSVAGGATADGTAIVQDPAGAAPQTWRLGDATTAGSFDLTESTSGQCVDVSGSSKATSADAVASTCGGGANEAWIFTPAGSGAYEITSVNSGLCLDVTGNSQTAGTQLIQYTCTGATNQQWTLTDVDGPPAAGNRVSFDQYSMMVNDKRVFLTAGEFDYFRLPSPSLWLDVFQKMKASGFNAVSIYFDWAYHSPAPGVYDFTGVRDVDTLLDMAAQAGLYVIARPGPYINGEVDGGGLPGWVDTQAGHSRSSAPDYLAAAEQWMGQINAILARHQLTNGTGTVILDQIENEYCASENSAGLDVNYMNDLEQQAKSDGITVPLFTNACYSSGDPWSSGTGAVPLTAWDAYPNGFACTGTTWRDIPDYTDLRSLTPASEPEYLAEFQGGSYDTWGGPGYAACRNYDDGPLERMITETAIAAGVTAQSYYMEFGGTNWGWDTDTLTKGYSSYDYGAGITEGRQLTTKSNSVKPLAYFTQSVPDLAMTQPLTVAGSTSALRVAGRVNPDTGAQIVIVQHSNRASTSTDSTTVTFSTPDGTFNAPVTVQGEDTKLLVANYAMGGQHLVYSTSELMTQTTTAKGDLAVFYGRNGLSGQTVLRYTSQPTVTVLSGSATSAFDAATGDLTLGYTHNGLIRIQITGGGRPALLLLIGDDNAVASMWLDSGVLSAGPELVRTATVTGTTLALTGDTGAAGILEVFPPSGVSTLTWNGTARSVTETSSGSWTASLAGPAAAPLPALSTWQSADGTQEAQPGFDDSSWTAANHTTTNNPTKPATSPVLYADDYGFHTGDIWYRGHFTATGKETGVNLTGDTGADGVWGVWLNGTWLGTGGDGQNVTFSIPAGVLKTGADNVIAVLVENMGHTEQSTRDDDNNKQPRGLSSASLVGSSAPLTWLIQGNLGGQSPNDPVRGPYNNGGQYGERNGWSLPGFPDSTWATVTTPLKNTNPGITWYRTTSTLDMPAGQDVSLGLNIASPSNRDTRELIYVNGWLLGRDIADLGPEHTFPIPDGILNPDGANTIAIAVWDLDSSTGGLGTVSWQVLGNVTSALNVAMVDSPTYAQLFNLTGTHTLTTSGQALDDPNSSTTEGTQIDTWQTNGGKNQQWAFTKQSDGSYQITNAYSGLCLDDANNSTKPGNEVIEWPCTSGGNQHWNAAMLADGAYELTDESSGLALTTSSSSNGGLVTQETYTGAPLQQWTIQ
jgi:beta-galactosidase GanA